MDFQIIKGSPTDEEIAALAVALALVEEKKKALPVSKPTRSMWGRPNLPQPLGATDHGWQRSSR